jgi:PTS system N-acetylglucosamine-specific IIC component
VRPGGNALQVVMGPAADRIAGEMRGLGTQAFEGTPARTIDGEIQSSAASQGSFASSGTPSDLAPWVAALGGAANVRSLEILTGRMRGEVRDVARVDRPALDAAAPRGWTQLSDHVVHALIGR